MLFIFIIFTIFLVFSLLSRKYNNPYRLIFLFGKKGAGKSSLMVKWMLRDIKNGWSVYTDMPDVNIDGVYYMPLSELIDHAPPANASIYLDEVGLSMDNRNYKSFPAGLRDFFALQRKYKCKVIVNSQSYDVDKKVRDRVDIMYLISNIGNLISIARPIRRTVTLTEASSQGESRIADQLKFAGFTSWRLMWLPRYHKWFNSFNAPKRDPVVASRVAGRSPKSELKLISKLWSNR